MLFDFEFIHKFKLNRINNKLNRKIKEFLSFFPENIQNNIKNNCYFAGGCIYSLYNNKKPKDYDIFCTNEETLKLIEDYFKKYYTKFKHNSIIIGKYHNKKLICTKYAISIDQFQVIRKFIGLPKNVVKEFDFLHNMFYWHSNKIITLSSWKYLKTNKLIFNEMRARDINGVLLRIPKFISRGMTINKKEHAKILRKVQYTLNAREDEILDEYLKDLGY